MIAIIETGSKQYMVKPGEKIQIEKIEANAGDIISFDKVLMISDEEGTNIEIGKPYIDGKSINATVIEQIKGPKLIVFKMKSKKRHDVKTGHRQKYTMVQMNDF